MRLAFALLCVFAVAPVQVISGQEQRKDFLLSLLLEIGTDQGLLTDEDMIKAATKAISQTDDNVEKASMLLRRGQALHRLEKYSEALADFRAAAAHSKDPEIQAWLGSTYTRLGKKDKAKAVFDGLIQSFPRYADGYVAYASFHFSTGDEPRLLSCIDTALALDDRNANAYHIRAAWLTNNGQYERALKDVEMVFRLSPLDGKGRLYFLRGYVLYKLRRYKESISCIQMSLRLDRNYKKSYLCLYGAYSDSGRVYSSLKVCLDMYEKWPEDAEIVAETIQSLLNVGGLEEASSIAQKTIGRADRNSKLYSAMGRVYLHQNKYELAERYYRLSLDVDSSDAGAMADLALLLSACPDPVIRNSKEALQLATTACEKTRWGSAWHIEALASAYAESNNFERARYYIGIAEKLARTDPNPHLRKRTSQMKRLFDADRPYRLSEERK